MRLVVTEGAVEIVGYRPERLICISARAWRNRASAAFNVWLDTSTCSSRPFSSALPNNCHQSARSVVSAGCACFHPGDSVNDFGGCSLNAGAAGTGGRVYFGPTVQPASASPQIATSTLLAHHFSGAFANRTSVPEVSESDGFSMISSCAEMPDTTSTSLPKSRPRVTGTSSA